MPAGRPKSLDEDAVLEAATRIWWREGVQRISLNELASALQVSKPSLARAFGGRDAMIGLALTRYGEQARAELATELAKAQNIGDLARRYLDYHADAHTCSDAPQGCFIAGAANECAAIADGPIRKALDEAMREGRTVLVRRLNDMGAQQPDTLATFLMAQTLAMSQLARSGASRDELAAIANLALKAVNHSDC